MFKIRKIESLDDPELEPFLTLRRPLEHRQRRIFVAEGEKPVRRLLSSDFGVVSVLLTPEWCERLTPLLEARPEEVIVYLAEKKLVEHLTGFTFYQGLLAVGRIPPGPTLEQILEDRRSPLLLLALDAISNAENLGVIVRNCAAFGANALLVGETCSSPFLRRAVRSSMGAIFHLPVLEASSLEQSLRFLRERRVRCYAAHPHTSQATLAQADFRADCCVIFGNEAQGISENILEACDSAFAIPMKSGIDSLNVSNASAVCLYEANRQRGRM